MDEGLTFHRKVWKPTFVNVILKIQWMQAV